MEGVENNDEIVHDLGNANEKLDLDALQRQMEAETDPVKKEEIAEQIRTHLGDIDSAE